MKIEETFRKRLKSLRLKLQLVHEEEAVKKAILLRDQFPSAVAVKRMNCTKLDAV